MYSTDIEQVYDSTFFTTTITTNGPGNLHCREDSLLNTATRLGVRKSEFTLHDLLRVKLATLQADLERKGANA